MATKEEIASVFASGAPTAILLVDVQHDFMDGGALAVPGASYGGEAGSYEASVAEFLATLRQQRPAMLRCFSQDFHPAKHYSFASEHEGAAPFEQRELRREVDGKEVSYTQTLWPDHCVQGTRGAEFVCAPLAPRFIGAGGAEKARGVYPPGGDAEGKADADTTDGKEVQEFVVQKGCRLLFDSYSPFEDDGGEKTGLGDFLRARGIQNVICFGLATDFCVHAAVTDGIREGFRVFCVKDLCRGLNPEYDWGIYEKAGCTLCSLEEAKQACAAN